jgi:2-iminobutanoate/2-iminopropanoate deaminase
VLEAAGSSIDNVVKVNIFLTNMEDFAAINTAYAKVFAKEPKPCRTCVAVHQLPLGTDVEIEVRLVLILSCYIFYESSGA